MEREDRERRTRTARRRRPQRGLLVAGACLVVLLSAGAWLARAEGGHLPPKVSVGGIPVGGLSEPDARRRLIDGAKALGAPSVSFRAADVPGLRLDVPRGVIAGAPRIDRALREARDARGPVSRLAARLGVSGDVRVPLRFALRGSAVAEIVDRLQGDLGRPSRSARVLVAGDAIRVTPAREGRRVDRPALRARLEELPGRVEVPLQVDTPPIDTREAEGARALAERIVAAGHTVTLRGREASLSPEVLRTALRFPTRDGSISVGLDPDVLRRALEQPLGAEGTPPRDARLVIEGDLVRLVPAVPGRLLDTEALAAKIVQNPSVLTQTVAFERSPADLTTREARAMRIRELVAEFSTPYSCCQPRVSNIKRAAEILDGTIIPAGGRFSLNEALGERTLDRGFVEAPQIEAGRLSDAVGGGVSQIATTMYNAFFFAGLELIAHTPHQFYISRYPMGREATVSWGGPELVVRNDWRAAVLVNMVATDSSVTVRLYSSKLGRRVETETGEPRAGRAPRTREVKKASLKPGERVVVQDQGGAGFTVSYTRRVFEGERLKRDESYTWSYSAQDGIVEVGPKKKPSPDKPTTTGEDPPPAAPPPPAGAPLPGDSPGSSPPPAVPLPGASPAPPSAPPEPG